MDGDLQMEKLMLFCFALVIVLAACAGEESAPSRTTVESSASYQALLNVNGDEYLLGSSEDIGKYQIDTEIGEVVKKISFELYPYKSFESNYLEEGTKLYSVKESNYVLLAEIEPGKYELFSK